MKEYILKFILIFLKTFYYISHPFFQIYICLNYYRNHKNKLPMFSNKLLEIPATDLADKIRLQEIKSEDVVGAYIERIEAVNPHINAIVENGFAQALCLARKVDKMCQATPADELREQYPLLGVPFTVKESCRLSHFLCTQGSVNREKVRATENGEAVGHLIDAGAIPLLVSNTPEFCFSWECFNYVTGRTLNPYNRQRTSGGSSGGEGALLGSGASIFGVGSDVAGSIRVPALFNGIFGHKPTRRVVSIAGHAPLPKDESGADYLVIGPMCRYAKDLPLLLHIMAGPNGPQLNLFDSISWKDIRVFHFEEIKSLFIVPLTNDTRTNFRKVVNHFEDVGSQIEALNMDLTKAMEISLSFLTPVPIDYVTLDPTNPESSPSIHWEIIKTAFGKSKYTFASLLFCILTDRRAFIPERAIQRYRLMGEKIRNCLINILGNDGVLLMPTCSTNAWLHYEYLGNLSSLVYVILFNALGFPCTHIPTGLSAKGLPLGIQVIAAPHQDRLCFTMAKYLEEVFGGWTPPMK